MSRYFNNYINILFSEANNEDFFLYLNEESIYFTNSLNNTVEKFSDRHKNYAGKLPNFRSTNKENLAKYKSAIAYCKDEQKKDDILDEEKELLNNVIDILNYKTHLINKGIKKTPKNTNEFRTKIIEYVKKKYPHLEVIDNKYFFNASKLSLRIIKSLSDFINVSNEIQKQIDKKEKLNIYYRGHSNYTYELVPSVYRNNYVNSEHKMYRDILIRNPEEFTHAKTTFEKLTIMQHYGLPTRLLDVTKNPLVALYFACENSNNENNPAEVLAFNPKLEDIKYYDSDTVCILSNIAKCERTLYNKRRIQYIQ